MDERIGRYLRNEQAQQREVVALAVGREERLQVAFLQRDLGGDDRLLEQVAEGRERHMRWPVVRALWRAAAGAAAGAGSIGRGDDTL